MNSSLEAEITSALQEAGIILTPKQITNCAQLLAGVIKWNKVFNLTAIAPHEMVKKHLIDSLVIKDYICGPTCLDVGTGAGFPGLPLAIATDHQWSLVDKVAKKVRFITQMKNELKLDNVTALNTRAENIQSLQFQTVVCRALGPIEKIVSILGPLCAKDGQILIMHTQENDQNLDVDTSGFQRPNVISLHVQGLTSRSLVQLKRT